MRWLRELETTTWPACGESPLDLGGDRGVHRGEHEAAEHCPACESLTIRSATFGGMAPSRRQLVASRYFLPAERSLAPSQVEFEPGMALQKLDEMLAHHSGGAENTYFNFRLHRCSSLPGEQKFTIFL